MRNQKKIATIMACAGASALLAFTLAGCGSDATENTADNTTVENANANAAAIDMTEDNVIRSVDLADPYASGIHHAVLEVEGYDPITIELNGDAAPITVSNFAKLAESGYYDGLTFYRFQDGFCMQGGTLGNNAAGHDSTIDQIMGEFGENGVDNPLAEGFGKGVVAMARSTDPDSASSTFFITLADGNAVKASLDGKYAAFGMIDEGGMAVIDKIVADHVAAASKSSMGMIEDEDSQAIIKSITMVN